MDFFAFISSFLFPLRIRSTRPSRSPKFPEQARPSSTDHDSHDLFLTESARVWSSNNRVLVEYYAVLTLPRLIVFDGKLLE